MSLVTHAPPAAPLRKGADQLDFVAGVEALRGPAVAHQLGRRLAFQRPEIGAAVVLLDLEHDEYMRRDEPVFLHHAGALDLVVLIEHRKRVMRQGDGASRRNAASRK
jgi:hypothetical protein